MSDTHAETVAYVAESQIPPSPPPASEVGIWHWARANLFPGPLNTILTILSIIFLAVTLPGLIQWAFIDAVWNASSLNECREIARANGVEHGFACWAVINERFNQFMFGFYPSELYWRPILAFILLLVALAPVLFSAIPRQLLLFSALYPVVAYWLIWGGSIWGPVAVLAGFAVAYAVIAAFDRFMDEIKRLNGLGIDVRRGVRSEEATRQEMDAIEARLKSLVSEIRQVAGIEGEPRSA